MTDELTISLSMAIIGFGIGYDHDRSNRTAIHPQTPFNPINSTEIRNSTIGDLTSIIIGEAGYFGLTLLFPEHLKKGPTPYIALVTGYGLGRLTGYVRNRNRRKSPYKLI